MLCAQNGGSVIMFLDPYQDPGNTVLDVLQLMDALARNPEEKSVTVVQP